MSALPHVAANVGLLQGNGVVSYFLSSFCYSLYLLLIGHEDDMISTDSEDNSSWLEVDSDSGVGFASNSDW